MFSWLIKHRNFLMFTVKSIIAIAGLSTFGQFICEETIQMSLFAFFPTFQSKNWEFANQQFPVLALHVNTACKTIYVLSYINPITGIWFKQFAKAAQTNLAVYAMTIKANLPVDNVPSVEAVAEHKAVQKFLDSFDAEYPVTITPSGKCFHREDCQFLSRSRNTEVVTIKEAVELGLRPCSCFRNIDLSK